MTALSGLGANAPVYLAVLAAGVLLLLVPGAGVYRARSRETAMKLFNRASWYPLVLLAVVIVAILR